MVAARGRREKAKAAKRKQRDESKRRTRARAADGRSLAGRVRSAARGPMLDCLVQQGWREEVKTVVTITRDGPKGIACVAFLVDVGCLGVKSCVVRTGLDQEQYEGFLEATQEHQSVEDCDPALALKLVRTAVDYARALGFEPAPEYRVAQQIFGDLDPSQCDEEIECGVDGKPFYAPGPDDDRAAILSRLRAAVGPGGFAVASVSRLSDLIDVQPGDPTDDDNNTCLKHPPIGELAEIEAWRSLRGAEARLVPEVLEYVREWHGPETIDMAWDDFSADCSDPKGLMRSCGLDGVFLVWFLFTWGAVNSKAVLGDDEVLDDEATAEEEEQSEAAGQQTFRIPFGLEFSLSETAPLDEAEQRFLDEACFRPFSFYAVQDVQPGRGLVLRDVLTGNEYTVLDRELSGCSRRGGILYARLVTMDGVAILCGCMARVLPPACLADLVSLRERLQGLGGPLNEERLRSLDDSLRAVYFDLLERQDNPSMPVLQNTDGEPLAPVKLVFALRCGVRQTFEQLRSLAWDHDEHDLLADATTDANGELRAVSVPWIVEGNRMNRGWNNTVLGTLSLDGTSLVVEVNSQERARRIRKEIERRLGEQVRFRSEEAQSMDELLAASAGAEAAEELPPEVRDRVAVMMAAHWEGWLDDEIPALGDRTPREAARTPEGRELLEALLCGYEWNGTEQDAAIVPDLAALRETLGLQAP